MGNPGADPRASHLKVVRRAEEDAPPLRGGAHPGRPRALDPGPRPEALPIATLTTRRLATAVLFVGLFAVTMGISVDSDTFWHLGAGAWMLEHGRVLDVDVFSHTAAGKPWVNPSWASDVLMAALFRGMGFGGLNLATGLIACLALLVVYRSERCDSYVRATVVALTAATAAFYFPARPQIFTLLLAAIFNLVLISYRHRGVNRLWLLPPLMVVWANLHGGFGVGLTILGVTFAGEAISTLAARFRAPESDLTRRRATIRLAWIGGATLACAAAAALNPYGPALLLYPFKTLSMGVVQRYIQEWQSPDFHARSAQFFILMWLVAFGAVGASRRRLGVTDFLLFGVFSASALVAARNVPLFAIVAAPIVMRHSASILEEISSRWSALVQRHLPMRPSRAMLALNWVVLGLVVLGTAAKVRLALSPGATERVVARSFPVYAAAFLRAHPGPGTMFNAYNFGGYLVWALYPVRTVYVDGRADLYADAFLDEYMNVYNAGPGWERTLARRDVGVVFVDPRAPIAQALKGLPQWKVAYRDWRAVVIVRRAG